MEISCLIVDDEPAAIRVVENYLQNLQHIKIEGTCNSAIEAIQFLSDNKVDLIFLDINMPGLSGIEFLKALRHPPVIVVTTAYREYAVESFELEVLDYLHKPFSFERFLRALQRVEETLKFRRAIDNVNISADGSKDHIFIKSDKKYQKIRFADLLFIEAMGDYCKIITTETTILSYLSLKKLDEMLPENFVRIHKSFIVQTDKIEQIEGNSLKIGDHRIPVGFSYREIISRLLK
jgi:DNA-binding LytR/AlgR family response regulator